MKSLAPHVIARYSATPAVSSSGPRPMGSRVRRFQEADADLQIVSTSNLRDCARHPSLLPSLIAESCLSFWLKQSSLPRLRWAFAHSLIVLQYQYEACKLTRACAWEAFAGGRGAINTRVAVREKELILQGEVCGFRLCGRLYNGREGAETIARDGVRNGARYEHV